MSTESSGNIVATHGAELERLEARRRQLSFQLDQHPGPDDVVSTELDMVEDAIARIHRDTERQRLAAQEREAREVEHAAHAQAVLRKHQQASLEAAMRERLVVAGRLETAAAGFLHELAQYAAAGERAFQLTAQLGAPKRRLQGAAMVGPWLSEILAGKVALGPRQPFAKGKSLTDLITGQLATDTDA